MTDIVKPTDIDALPPEPLPTDPPAEFNTKAFNLVAALKNLVSQMNASIVNVWNNAKAAHERAVTAGTSAADAAGSSGLASSRAAEALGSATQASGYASTAATAAGNANASWSQIQALYLGAKAAHPVTDNNGQPLQAGASYSNTTDEAWYWWSGSAWVLGRGDPATVDWANVLNKPTSLVDTVKKSGDTMSGSLNWAAPVTIASAGTTNIGAAASNRVIVTGTVTITSLGAIAAGASRTVTFVGALTLTHHAANLILPGAANITTAAGDVAEFESLGAGWRCTNYMRANGTALSTAGLVATVTPFFGKTTLMADAPVGQPSFFTSGDGAGSDWPTSDAVCGWIVDTKGSSARKSQTAEQVLNVNGQQGWMFVRFKHDTDWSPWRRVFTDNTIIEKMAVLTAVSGSYTADPAVASIHHFAMTGNTTVAIPNPRALGDQLIVRAYQTGSFSLAWSGNFFWPKGYTQPSLAVGEHLTVTFISRADTTGWFAYPAGIH